MNNLSYGNKVGSCRGAMQGYDSSGFEAILFGVDGERTCREWNHDLHQIIFSSIATNELQLGMY